MDRRTAGTPVPASGSPRVVSAPLRLGHGPAGGFTGHLDEVRIEQEVRSPGWMATHVANLADPDFVDVGPAETSIEGWSAMGSWLRRTPITVPYRAAEAGPGERTVLVSFTDAAITAAARTDGADLVFTAADGVTRLDHVLAWFDRPAGEVRAWVSIPDLSPEADATIYLYHDNPAARDQQDPVAVFGLGADLVVLAREP